MDHIRSEDNIADPLMKGLAREKVWKTSKGMGLKSIGSRITCDGNLTYRLEIPRNRFKG